MGGTQSVGAEGGESRILYTNAMVVREVFLIPEGDPGRYATYTPSAVEGVSTSKRGSEGSRADREHTSMIDLILAVFKSSRSNQCRARREPMRGDLIQIIII